MMMASLKTATRKKPGLKRRNELLPPKQPPLCLAAADFGPGLGCVIGILFAEDLNSLVQVRRPSHLLRRQT